MNVPWWGWFAIALVCCPVVLLSYLWWASQRVPMDTDLWVGGNPGTRWLTAEERSYGASDRRAS